MIIRNGTLANKTKYALYVFGATVSLKNVTVDTGAYVASGWLQIVEKDVGVKGVLAKTSSGSITLTEGRYVEDPRAFVAVGRQAQNIVDGDYNWVVVEANQAIGFADGFIVDMTPDKDGNYLFDFTGAKAVGNLRKEAQIVLAGDVSSKVTVKAPDGYTYSVFYDPTSNQTVIKFALDEALLTPVLGTAFAGDRPFTVEDLGNGKKCVTLHIKNAIAGFYYQLQATQTLGDKNWHVATQKQALQNGNVTLEYVTDKDCFWKVNVSDRP